MAIRRQVAIGLVVLCALLLVLGWWLSQRGQAGGPEPVVVGAGERRAAPVDTPVLVRDASVREPADDADAPPAPDASRERVGLSVRLDDESTTVSAGAPMPWREGASLVVDNPALDQAVALLDRSVPGNAEAAAALRDTLEARLQGIDADHLPEDPERALLALDDARIIAELLGGLDISAEAARAGALSQAIAARWPDEPAGDRALAYFVARGSDPRWPADAPPAMRDAAMGLVLNSDDADVVHAAAIALGFWVAMGGDLPAATERGALAERAGTPGVDLLLAQYGDDDTARAALGRLLANDPWPQLEAFAGRVAAARGEPPLSWRQALVGAVWACAESDGEGIGQQLDVEVALPSWRFGPWMKSGLVVDAHGEPVTAATPAAHAFTACVERRAAAFTTDASVDVALTVSKALR